MENYVSLLLEPGRGSAALAPIITQQMTTYCTERCYTTVSLCHIQLQVWQMIWLIPANTQTGVVTEEMFLSALALMQK